MLNKAEYVKSIVSFIKHVLKGMYIETKSIFLLLRSPRI